ncbi:MAG: DUF6691 family protein [Hyphomicrobiales bacterium]
MASIAVFIAGLLFGAGVTVSGMVNPMKVLNFMDLFGHWDPTLIFVMGAGLVVTFIGYRLVLTGARPLYAPSFHLPQSKGLDGRLIGGAALFGLGWGLTGFCPGPAVASLVFGRAESFIFVIAMAAGMIAARHVMHRPPSRQELAGIEG